MSKLSKKIKNKIKLTTPKPKWQFTLKVILIEVGFATLWILAVIGLGVLVYVLIHYSPWEYLPRNFKYFWQGFLGLPWELLIICAIFIVISYYLFKKINFMYRWDKWLLVGIIVLSLVGGYLIAESAGINKKIAQIPSANKIYKQQGRLIQAKRGTVIIGSLAGVKKEYIVIKDLNGNIWQIVIDKSTYFPQGKKIILGEIVRVHGIQINDQLKAVYIKPLGIKLRGFSN